MSKQGFTLLEIMISIGILIMISFGIYHVTSQTFLAREILSKRGDFFNEIRLAMNIVDRDFSMIYTPAILKPAGDLKPDIVEQMAASALGRSSAYWGSAVHPSGIRPVRFVGEAQKMSFVSVSNKRIYKNSKESEFLKVSYELVMDPKVKNGPTQYILTRTISPNAFNDDEFKDKLQKKYPLLDGIKSLTFNYYKRDQEQWRSRWDGDTSDLKDLLPDMLEVKIEVTGGEALNFSGIYHFRLEIPYLELPKTL